MNSARQPPNLRPARLLMPPCATSCLLRQACSERIEAKGAGECEQWYFDFLKCVDKCAAPKIFSRLK